jgi:hypothetical protein
MRFIARATKAHTDAVQRTHRSEQYVSTAAASAAAQAINSIVSSIARDDTHIEYDIPPEIDAEIDPDAFASAKITAIQRRAARNAYCIDNAVAEARAKGRYLITDRDLYNADDVPHDKGLRWCQALAKLVGNILGTAP